MNLEPVLSPGWLIGAPFPVEGAVVTINDGAGVGSTAPQVLLEKEIPPSGRIYIEKLVIRVVDLSAYDQVYFALRHNAAIVLPFNKISGTQVVDEHYIPIEREFESGKIEVVGTNISGTSETGASQALNGIRVVARLSAFLLRYTGDR